MSGVFDLFDAIGPAMALTVGLVLLGFGVMVQRQWQQFCANADKIDGQVTAISQHTGSDGVMYSPVVNYQYQGIDHTFTASFSTSTIGYQIDQSISLWVSRTNPKAAKIDAGINRHIGKVLIAVGLVCMAFFAFIVQSLWMSLGIAAVLLLLVGSKIYPKYAAFKAKNSDFSLSSIEPDSALRDSDELIINKQGVQETQRKNRAIMQKVASLFAIIGLIMSIGGGYWSVQRHTFFDRALEATGQVTRIESSRSNDSTVYYPFVSYRPQGASSPVEFKHNVGSSSPSWSRGEAVNVLYDPVDHREAMIDDGLWNWFGPALVTTMGFIFFLSGSISYRKARGAATTGR